MLNKRRQELIIQNLKSISAQVRLMAVDQLLTLPSISPAEKIKYLEPCLNDSDDGVKQAAKVAIEKLGGGSSSVSSANSQSNLSGFKLPSLNLEPAKTSTENGLSLPDLNLGSPSKPETQPMPALTAKAPSQSAAPKVGFMAQSAQPVMMAQPVQNVDSNAAVPQNESATTVLAKVNAVSQEKPKPVGTPKGNLIDGPVDPSLPQVNGHTDIGFLLQHIKTISATKPAGYLTRLFELSKSVHEEVALTALQALVNAKDKRVPPHILDLLNVPDYSSQRRFLMLKIVMEFDIPFNSDLLENILVKEKDVIVKSGLVKVFARNCGSSGVPLLIRCLNDDDPRVRANTVEVIEAQNIKGCEREIIKLLNDSENRVKVNAAKYLVKIGYQQAFYTLRAMLVSPEVWLRDSVIFALGEIGDQPSLILLKAALKDPNQGIRLSVLKALSKMNNSTSRQILKAACGDPDAVVAQIAISLYEKIKDTPVNPIAPTVKATFNFSAAASDNLTQNTADNQRAEAPLLNLPQGDSTAQNSMAAENNQTAQAKVEPPVSQISAMVSEKNQKPLPAVPLQSKSTATAVKFADPRAAAAYAKLCSPSVDEQRQGIKETIFIPGADHMILLAKAITLADFSIRLASVKLLSRQRSLQAKEMLKRLSNDSNETVASLAKKVLTLFQ